MSSAARLAQLAEDIAAAIPEIDATVSHENYGNGLGGFEEPRQVEMIVEMLEAKDAYHDALRTEVPYPDSRKQCDLVLETENGQMPIEAKLLRFNRANGTVEPGTYSSIFSPVSNSVVSDAAKLFESSFGVSGGLLGIYYERGDETAPVYDPHRLAEKTVTDIDYWFDIDVETRAVSEFEGLRHEVHRRGAVVTWEVIG